jgi:hypothetical protein
MAVKGAPFNNCDYLCEACTEREGCPVFELLRRRAASKGVSGCPTETPESFLENVKETLDEAMKMLERLAAEFSMDCGEIVDMARLDHCAVEEDELHQLSMMFTMKTHAFLKKMKPSIKRDVRKFFDDVVWHHRLVSIKTQRAVASDFDGLTDDAIHAADVAKKSLNTCIAGLKKIGKSHVAALDECKSLSGTALEIKRRIEKRFALNPGLRAE